jgi:hypothetical protein
MPMSYLEDKWHKSVENQPVNRRLGGRCEMAASRGPSSVDGNSVRDLSTEAQD